MNEAEIRRRRTLPWLPERIVCLTEETTETLYLLGEQDRIVGISGYTVRPPEARRDKPRVSAFTSAKIGKIVDLKPDLVLCFSDLQADIAAQLAKQAIAVHLFNQRSIAGIFAMITTLGALVGAAEKAAALCARLQDNLDQTAAWAAQLPVRPKVYFEEWDDPLITGIGWVSELIVIAGGIECFPERAGLPAAKQRILADPQLVIERAPDIIIGSWCGKKFRPEKVRARRGWSALPAVRDDELHEVKSPIILQPGPAALGEGLNAIRGIVENWSKRCP